MTTSDLITGEPTVQQPKKELHEELGALARKWRSLERQDLIVRYDTGKLLNEHLGDPTQRQTRGEEVLKAAAKQLKTSVSELSRVRHFAHHFKSVEDFKKRHPEVTNWTGVKALLPRLTGKQKAGPGGIRPSRAVKNALVSLNSQLEKVPSDLPDEEKEELLELFQKVAEAFETRLMVSAKVESAAGQTVVGSPEGDGQA